MFRPRATDKLITVHSPPLRTGSLSLSIASMSSCSGIFPVVVATPVPQVGEEVANTTDILNESRIGSKLTKLSSASTTGAKRTRAVPWAPDPSSWPGSRLNGKHLLGWHDTGDHHCDYPACVMKNASYVKAPRLESHPGSRGGDATPLGLREFCIGESSDKRPGRTKIYCRNCVDSSGRRPMNFHAECWNKWHGLLDDGVSRESCGALSISTCG